MIDSKEKGSRAELLVRDLLRKHTGLQFERTPMSGALDQRYGLKGDLYVPNKENVYAIEIKHYKDDHISSKILTDKSPQIIKFWEQTTREAEQVSKIPLLIFKFDRSKIFVAFNDKIPQGNYNYLYTELQGQYKFYITLLEDWLINERPKFIL